MLYLRKWLALLLTACMLISMVPATLAEGMELTARTFDAGGATAQYYYAKVVADPASVFNNPEDLFFCYDLTKDEIVLVVEKDSSWAKVAFDVGYGIETGFVDISRFEALTVDDYNAYMEAAESEGAGLYEGNLDWPIIGPKMIPKSSNTEFLQWVAELAVNDYPNSRVLPSVVTAQAILETGWGKSEIMMQNHALFGVKATSSWTGGFYSTTTREYYDTWTTTTALFKSYSSWEECLADHTRVLSLSRYDGVIGGTDYRTVCQKLQSGGYATDPEYAQKLINIIETYSINNYDTVGRTETITAQGADFVHRSDGIWLFPLPSQYYNHFSDWAGCPGYGTCPFHNVSEPQYGDNYHTGQAYGHNGFDVATGGNKCDVYAAASGTAYCSYSSSARGYYVVVEHSLGNGYSYYSYYQHLSAISVENGTPVTVGQTIGKVGNTGGNYGIHLHFGIVLGTSGRGINAPNSLEGNGWVLTDGFQEGRICNNPALNSPAGFPTGNISSLRPHAGSVMYTFNISEVTIGESEPISPATTLEFRDVVYPRQFKIDTRIGWYLQGGTLASNVELSSIRSEIRRRDGTLMHEYGPISISGKSFDIGQRDFDKNVNFKTITTPGDYDWILIATDSAGRTLSMDMPFHADNNISTQTDSMSKTWPDVPIYDTLQFIDVIYPRQFKIDIKIGWYLQGGTLASDVELSSIRSEIRRRDGTILSEYGPISISGKSFDIGQRDFDRNVNFKTITTPGDYDWILIATDSAGRTLSMDMPITAIDSGSTQTATMSKTWPDVPIGEEMLTGHGRPIADGTYLIVSAADQNYYLDIEGMEVPAANTTNVSLCGPRASSDKLLEYDLWAVTYIDNGFYSIIQYNSNASLDVAGADKTQQANIMAYESHGGSNQLWAISSHPYGGYRIEAKVSGFSLDIYGCNIANGTNIQQYPSLDTPAQAWVFIPYYEVQSVSLNKSYTTLTVGSSETLLATIYPGNATNQNIAWVSDNNSIATVTNGVVTANAMGVATITATTENGGKTATCKVIVHDTSLMTLPAKLTSIGAEAFTGIAAREVIVPSGVKTIGSKAFANCANLKLIWIPDSVNEIAYNAFTGSPNVCIIAEHANTATEFADAMGIQWVTLDGNY